MISREIEGEWLGAGWPIIFDTTGEHPDKHIDKMKSLIGLGYEVAVFLVNVPTQASVDRDIDRGKIDPTTGRQKGRTVGAGRTTKISQDYQKAVVQQRGYYKALDGMPNVTIMTDEVFNNIFDLKTGELLTMPTVITPEMLPPELDPNQNPAAFPKEKAKMEQAISRMDKWANTPVQNPKGQLLLKAMRSLVKKSGGRLGQNMNDIVIAMAKSEFQEDEEILAAAKHLSELGGASVVMKKRKHGDTRKSAGASEDAPYLQHAVRGKKDVGDATIRGLTGRTGKQNEALNYDDLVQMIREVITNET